MAKSSRKSSGNRSSRFGTSADGIFNTKRSRFSSKYALGKRGSIQDILYIMVGLFILSMVILVVYKVSDEINTEFQANSDLPDRSKSSHQQITNMFPGVIDNSFLFITVFLSIGALVLAAMVRIHPIFIPIFIMAWIFLIFFSAIFSNAYQEMAANAEFAALASNMTFMHQVMTTLPFVIGIIGALLAIVMYKAYRGEQYGY